MTSNLGSIQASLRALKETNASLDIDLDHQIVTRKDRNEFPEQVKLISGGGAGHEPGHTGFVGNGLLTTAVSGAIFTSPPVQAILQGILLTGSKDSAILMIVANYSGDRLNFALAEKMARNRYGYNNIKTLLVADDVALDNVPEQVGNRGLAGTILIHKIAGAMAEMGKSLDEIYELCLKVKPNTIGFSCKVDWSSQRVRKIEIGKGIHGEPGAFTMEDQPDFVEIVGRIVEKLKNVVAEKTPVVVLLNNLGGPAHLFSLISDEMIKQLKCYSIKKIISGSFFTSLGHEGASVTLLELTEENQDVLQYLEYETELFRNEFKKSSKTSSFIQSNIMSSDISIGSETGIEIDGKIFQSVLNKICETIMENQSQLNQMDSEFGDGDTGDTLARGARAIFEFIKDNNNDRTFSYPLKIFQSISHLLSLKMGGTSGALMGIFLESSSEAFKTTNFASSLWLKLGNQALSEAGRSKTGHRTMLDVLWEAQKALDELNISDRDSLEKLKVRCFDAVLSTQKMKPGSGRAVYNLGSDFESAKYPDPGAFAIGVIVETIVNYLINL